MTSGDHLQIRAEGFQAAARALNAAGNRDLRREVYRTFKEIAKPAAQETVAEASAQLPRRGGLSARVAAAKIGQTNATTGSSPRITVNLSTREGYDLRRMDEGTVWHKVWGREPWKRQTVPARAFSAAWERRAPELADKVMQALERTTKGIGRIGDERTLSHRRDRI